MSTLVQISDTHFGTEQAPVVEALVALVRDLAPELVVLSGDITQRARRAQFTAARTFMERLSAPWVAIPGNHDIPLFDVAARVFRPYANYMRAFGEQLEPEYCSSSLLVVCVNTTRAARHKDGEVSAAQIERVAERLRNASAAQLRLVVTHQPMHVTREQDRKNLLHGHDVALREWANAGADIVMGGHIHLPYVRRLAPERTGAARSVWCAQAGTAVSHRVRGGIPNSVNVLKHAPADACVVERWDYASDAGAFLCAGGQQIDLRRSAHAD